jgi:hypothetical protein
MPTSEIEGLKVFELLKAGKPSTYQAMEVASVLVFINSPKYDPVKAVSLSGVKLALTLHSFTR